MPATINVKPANLIKKEAVATNSSGYPAAAKTVEAAEAAAQFCKEDAETAEASGVQLITVGDTVEWPHCGSMEP